MRAWEDSPSSQIRGGGRSRLACWPKMEGVVILSSGSIFAKPEQELKGGEEGLSLIHISEPTRLGMISYAVFCLKKKKS